MCILETTKQARLVLDRNQRRLLEFNKDVFPGGDVKCEGVTTNRHTAGSTLGHSTIPKHTVIESRS